MQPPSGVPSAPLMTENFHLCESVFHTVQVLQKAQSATLKNTEVSTDNPL
jgi:hypothetical protein